jgi:hypothetical protein
MNQSEQLKTDIRRRLSALLAEIEQAPFEQITNAIEALYDRALLAEFLAQRAARKTAVFERVEQAIDSALQQEDTVKTHEAHDSEAKQSHFHLHPEIKVVPHPEGPPVPVIEQEPHTEVEAQHTSATEAIEFAIQGRSSEAIAEEIAAKASKPEAAATIAPPEVFVGTTSAQPTEPPTPATPMPSTTKLTQNIAEKAQQAPRQPSLHQRLAAKNLNFGLNDRIAYVKHLFDGSTDDFSRVVNQLNTYETWQEAEDFLLNMVKPDYNWVGKEQYEERFVAQIKTRFEA